MAMAEQGGRGQPVPGFGEAGGIEPRKGAQPVGRVEIDHQHVDDAVGPGLQLEPPLLFQSGAQQGR